MSMSARDGKSPARLLFLVTGATVLIIGVDYLLDGMLRARARAVLEPVKTVVYRIDQKIFRNEFWKTRAELQRRIDQLSEELERDKVSRAAVSVAQSENAILRSLARAAQNSHGVTVPITSSFTASPYGTFTIGGGMSSGIQIGDLALAGDGFVLGSITEVSENSSIVSSVFSPGVKTDVVVGESAFTLSGRGGGNARASVPREMPLTLGDPVVAPSYAQRPVGVIGRIESASSSAFSDVFVLFPYNLNALRYVFVTPRL